MGKYVIADEPFRTKREIVERVRGILARTPVGEYVVGEDLVFMLALLQRHRWAAQKIGAGIRAIRVDLNTHWKPTKAFVLNRRDGSETDFSYLSCIYPQSPETDFREACRHAVVDDVLEFKRRVFDSQGDEFNEVPCAITGLSVGWNDAHVDHAPPWTFRRIVDAFIQAEGIDVRAVVLNGDGDGEYQHRFTDADVAEQFRQFHNERARLRVVTREANLRRCK